MLVCFLVDVFASHAPSDHYVVREELPARLVAAKEACEIHSNPQNILSALAFFRALAFSKLMQFTLYIRSAIPAAPHPVYFSLHLEVAQRKFHGGDGDARMLEHVAYFQPSVLVVVIEHGHYLLLDDLQGGLPPVRGLAHIFEDGRLVQALYDESETLL